jgi:hypothetical protein
MSDITDLGTVLNREMFIARWVVVDHPFHEALLGTIAFQRLADSRIDQTAQTWPKAGASDNFSCLSLFINSKFNQNNFSDSGGFYTSQPVDDACSACEHRVMNISSSSEKADILSEFMP